MSPRGDIDLCIFYSKLRSQRKTLDKADEKYYNEFILNFRRNYYVLLRHACIDA